MKKRTKKNKNEKVTFIIETEMAILAAILKGHKCSDDDQFAESRKIVEKYRIELGLKKKGQKRF